MSSQRNLAMRQQRGRKNLQGQVPIGQGRGSTKIIIIFLTGPELWLPSPVAGNRYITFSGVMCLIGSYCS